jgi:hypothetical protein
MLYMGSNVGENRFTRFHFLPCFRPSNALLATKEPYAHLNHALFFPLQ